MQKIKALTHKVIVKVVENMLDADFFGWPPECMGIYYQPQRPAVSSNEIEQSKGKA